MLNEDRWRASRSDLWVLVFLLVLVLWTFRLVIAGTHAPFMSSLRDFEPWRSTQTHADQLRDESFADDPTTQTYPWAVYAHENMQDGDFPLWNTRMFSGTPFIANRLTGLFDPLTLIPVWLLPPIEGLSFFYFLHYLMAAWFMYLFLKSMGLSRPASAFGAIAYIFQGAYVPWMGFIVADKAYLLMSLYYLNRTCAKGDRVGILGFIISFLLLTVNSYPQMVVFAMYIFIAWILFTQGGGIKPAVRRLFGLGMLLFLIFLLGAMQHLPMLEFYFNSLRAHPEFDTELASRTGLEVYDSPLSLLAIYFPTLWGDYLEPHISPLPEFVLRIYNHAYIGILAAVGFLFAPMVWKNRYAKFFTVLALIGLSFIAWHGFYMFMAKIIPGLRISTVKPDFLTLTCMIIVSSFVLDHLIRNIRTDEAFTRKFMQAYSWFLGIFVALVVMSSIWMMWGFLDIDISTAVFDILKHLIPLWLAGVLLYFYARKKLHLKSVVVGIFILLIIDLVPYHEHFMPLVPKDRLCYRTESINFLSDRMVEDGPFRIFRDRTIVLAPNTPMLYGLDEPGGFDSFVSADYAHFFRLIDPSMSRNSRTLDLPGDYIYYRQPFWSFLGIRYLLSPGEMPSLPPQWELAEQNELYIYENTEWLPRWFLVPRILPVESIEDGYAAAQVIDPSTKAVVVGIEHIDIPPSLLGNDVRDADFMEAEFGSIELMHYGADELRLSVNATDDAYLVFADTWYPGWRAWIDGKETEIYRTDGLVKGIVVPSGSHEVRFLYDPPLYKLGWLLFFIGLALVPFASSIVPRLIRSDR